MTSSTSGSPPTEKTRASNDARRPRRERASPRRDWRLRQDYRAHLPPLVARFIGYRPPGAKPPYHPLPVFPCTLLRRIPLKHEVWITGTLGSFIGLLLIAAVMSTATAFRDDYHAPILIASFGATAVLIYGSSDSPLSQPRNLIGGHVISAIIGVAITRLFVLDPAYEVALTEQRFHAGTFVNAGLSMAVSLLAMFATGTVHPPGGATALISAIEPSVIRLSWRYIPVVLVSALLMFAWALVINNVGRRRWPLYWWSPERRFVKDNVPLPREDEELAIATQVESPVRVAEDGGRTQEALKQEHLQGWGGTEHDLQAAVGRASRPSRTPGPSAA